MTGFGRQFGPILRLIRLISVHQPQRNHQRLLQSVAAKLDQQRSRATVSEIHDQMHLFRLAAFRRRRPDDELNRRQALQRFATEIQQTGQRLVEIAAERIALGEVADRIGIIRAHRRIDRQQQVFASDLPLEIAVFDGFPAHLTAAILPAGADPFDGKQGATRKRDSDQLDTCVREQNGASGRGG